MRFVLATLLGFLFLGAARSALPSRGLVLHAPRLVVTRFRLHAAPIAVTATPGAVWVVVAKADRDRRRLTCHGRAPHARRASNDANNVIASRGEDDTA